MKIAAFSLVFLYFYLFSVYLALAHDINLPYWGEGGIVSCEGSGCNFCDFFHTLQHLVYFGITLTVIGIFPLMVAVGGIMIMAAGTNEQLISQGKRTVKNGALGSLIALGAFLIVNTVLYFAGNAISGARVHWPVIECHPESLAILGEIPPPSEGLPPGGGGAGEILTEAEARELLARAGIEVKDGVRLDGIKKSTIEAMVDLKQKCGCEIIITSALDGIHNQGTYSHADGYKVDLRLTPSLTNYIERNYQYIGVRRSDGALLYKDPSNSNRIFAKEGNHWDVLIKP